MKKPYIFYIIVIGLVLVIVFLLFQNISLKNNITGAAISDSDIILRLEQFTELKGKQPFEIKRLTEPRLSQLKQEQPVVYADTEEGDYLVKYDDRWVVYDFENNRIIRDFIIQNIELGE